MKDITTETVRAWLLEHQGASVDELVTAFGANTPASHGRVLHTLRQLRDQGVITEAHRWFARTEPTEAPSTVATRHMRAARHLAEVIADLVRAGQDDLAARLRDVALQI